MRNRLLRIGLALSVTLTVLVGGFAARGQGPDQNTDTRSITIPEPAKSEVNSNLPPSGLKKDGLRQLEDDLFKPLKKTFNPKSSLDAVFVPPQPRQGSKKQIPLTKKEKEQEAEKREWVFLSPEELTSGPSLEEIFNVPEYGPDGMEKKKLTPLERYYENLERKSNGETNSNSNSNSKGRDPKAYTPPNETDKKEEPESPERTKQAKKDDESFDKIQKLFDARSESRLISSTEQHGTVFDIFGLGENKPSAEWTKAQKGRMDEFKELIGFSSPGSAPGSLNLDPFAPSKSLGDSSPKTLNPFGGASASVGARSSGADSGWGKINAGSGSAGLPDFSSKGFGSPAWAPLPARSDPVSIAPPSPTFNAPKRPF